MFTDSQFDTISILYTIVSLNVLWRLKTNWKSFWDEVVLPADRQLADAVAVFLLIPTGVFFHELGHAIATWQMGGTVLEFQWRIFWGYVVPGGQFTLPQLWWLAFSGNLVSILLGAIAIPLFQVVNRPILKEVFRTFARVELVYSLILYPLISFVGQQGDWLMIYNFKAQPYAQITLMIHALTLIGLWCINKGLSQPLHPPDQPPTTDLLQQAPARYYRQKIRYALSVFDHSLPPSSPNEEKLAAYLDALYMQQRQRLAERIKQSPDSTTIEVYSFEMFVIAIGLFAFGRLDMVPEILDHLPQSGNLRQLALVLRYLLPLPGIDPLTQPQDVMIWVDHYRSQLNWDERLERFILIMAKD